MLSKLLILFIFFIQLFFLPVALAKTVDQIVAVVNDEIITLSDLHAFRKRLEEEKPQKKLLDSLIEERLTRQLIEKLNLVPDPEEVETQINSILKAQGITRKELLEFLKQRGMTYAQYRENIQRGMENERLLDREIKSSITIKEQDIRSYYYSHVKQQEAKTSYHIRQLFLPAETKDEQDKKLEIVKKAYEESQKGASLESIIKKYSTDASQSASLGDLGFISEDDLIAPLKKAVKRLRIKEVSPPILSNAGVHLLELLEVKKQTGQSYQEAKESIQRILYEKEFKRILNRWIKLKKEEAYIKKIPLKSLKSVEPRVTTPRDEVPRQ